MHGVFRDCHQTKAWLRDSYLQLDVFPNWRNSVQIGTLLMIGHAFLSTNLNTLQSHLSWWSCGKVLASKARGWWVQIPAEVGEFFNF